MWGTLPRVLDRVCLDYADHTALVEGDRTLSFDDLRLWSNGLANCLVELGVERGDHVGLLMPNCLEFVPAMHGIWKAGAAIVQMAARASLVDLRLFLETSNATTIIYHDEFDAQIEELRVALPSIRGAIRLRSQAADQTPSSSIGASNGWHPRDYAQVVAATSLRTPPDVQVTENDTAFIAFTSGTTGLPKGVVQTHLTWSHYAITAGLEIGDIQPGEVFAHGGALTHFTQSFVMPTLLRGGRNVILPSLDPEVVLDAIERERITSFATVPTALHMLLDHPRFSSMDLSSLRTIIYAGSPISSSVLQRVLQTIGPILVQTYAGTEQGYVTLLGKEQHHPGVPQLSSAGRVRYQVDVQCRDGHGVVVPTGEVGEIWTRQTGQMVRYLDAELEQQRSSKDWIQTGDVGYQDAAGFLYIVDRAKDMIVSGGINIFPQQIEAVLDGHVSVAQSAVIGVPDTKWGEAVKAYIVPTDGQQPEPAELLGLVREQKGSVWVPKSLEFIAELPMTPSGKVDKKTLRAPYWQGQQRQVH